MQIMKEEAELMRSFGSGQVSRAEQAVHAMLKKQVAQVVGLDEDEEEGQVSGRVFPCLPPR